MFPVNQEIISDTDFNYNVINEEAAGSVGNDGAEMKYSICNNIQQSLHVINTQLSLKPYDCSDHITGSSSNVSRPVARRRRPIVIRPIVKLRQRQVTFSKRKSSLLRKAQELSSLSGADVGLIVFSPSGKLFHYATSSLDTSLERYQIYSEKQNDACKTFATSQVCSCSMDLMSNLQNIERIMLEDDFDQLDLKQLAELEEELESSIHQVKQWKMELLCETTNGITF